MDVLTTNEALVVAANHGIFISRVTMISWADRRGIGYKIGGRWYIEKHLLMELLAGGKHDGANKTEISAATDCTANDATENRGGD